MYVDSSEGAVIDELEFSDGALRWLRANQQKLEQMIQRGQKIYNLDEWETYERWANYKMDEIWKEKDATERRMQTMERELRILQGKYERIQTERTDLLGKIARLQQGGETFANVHEDFARGMIAIEALVTGATTEPWSPIPPFVPIKSDERIMDRLNALVERMAQMEKMKEEEQIGCVTDHWDPETSFLATQQMHDLLYSR